MVGIASAVIVSAQSATQHTSSNDISDIDWQDHETLAEILIGFANHLAYLNGYDDLINCDFTNQEVMARMAMLARALQAGNSFAAADYGTKLAREVAYSLSDCTDVDEDTA